MARSAKSAKRQPANRFYHSAKISEYQFKRVLWSFVRDEPVAVAAEHIALSANSINAIYHKIRVYFTALGVFEDIYQGRDPQEGSTRYDEKFEFHLLGFHIARAKRKRRTKDTAPDEVDYNFCESLWRFHYDQMMGGRSTEAVYQMMYAHLLGHIRLSGPVGLPVQKTPESASLERRQLEQRLLWMERNAPGFRDETSRATLREIREKHNELEDNG